MQGNADGRYWWPALLILSPEWVWVEQGDSLPSPWGSIWRSKDCGLTTCSNWFSSLWYSIRRQGDFVSSPGVYVCACECGQGNYNCVKLQGRAWLYVCLCAYMSVYMCLGMCIQVWMYTCAYAYKYTCVRVCPGLTSGLWLSDRSSHSMHVSGPSWSEATGSLFVHGQVSSGIHLFLKSVFLNIVFLNWIFFCMCQGRSSFKEGPWRILCNEFEFEFSYIRFYKMAKCAPGVSSSIGHFSTAGRSILPVSFQGHKILTASGILIPEQVLPTTSGVTSGSYLTFLSLGFFTYKMQIVTPASNFVLRPLCLLSA